MSLKMVCSHRIVSSAIELRILWSSGQAHPAMEGRWWRLILERVISVRMTQHNVNVVHLVMPTMSRLLISGLTE
jgi:hypothetical protein